MAWNKKRLASQATADFVTGIVKIVLLALFASEQSGAAVAPVVVHEHTESQQRFASRQGLPVQQSHLRCSKCLPHPETEGEADWVVTVHLNRAPTAVPGRDYKLGNLQGSGRPRRELPHQYFVHAMEMTLSTISEVDPGAKVELLVFTEGFGGSMVDEMGSPIDWDIPREICDVIGTECVQVRP